MLLLILIPATSFLNNEGLPFLRSILFAFARHHSILYFLIPTSLHLLLPFLVDVEDVQSVRDKTLLYIAVKGSVCGEAGSIVDFKQGGIEFMVNHDVKSQDLETHIVGKVIWMDTGDGIAQSRVSSDNCLYEDIVNFLLQLVHIVSFLSNLFEDRSQRSLMSDVHVCIVKFLLVTD